MKIKSIKDVKTLEGKKVLVRVGVNVPLNDEGEIESDFRLRKILPTIEFLVEQKAKIILIGHIGRDPKQNLEKVFN
jgi:phosphoglycerate kinase